MTERYYLTDNGHVLISGATGARDDYGGKTVLANWWFSSEVEKGHRHMGVFINPKGHGFINGRSVRSLKGIAESYRAGHRLFNVHTDTPEPYIEWMKQMPGEKVAVFDEAQQYADNDVFQWVLNQGGNLDEGSIRALVVTQRPWNMPEPVRLNMPVKIWVGPMTPEGRKFFQAEQMPELADDLDGEIQPYHWAVTDAGELQHVNPPVPAKYA